MCRSSYLESPFLTRWMKSRQSGGNSVYWGKVGPHNGQPENLVKRLQWQKTLEGYDQENYVIWVIYGGGVGRYPLYWKSLLFSLKSETQKVGKPSHRSKQFLKVSIRKFSAEVLPALNSISKGILEIISVSALGLLCLLRIWSKQSSHRRAGWNKLKWLCCYR